MSDALRFEWVRLRTLRSTYWLIASALVLNATAAFLVAFVTRDDPLDNDIVGTAITSGGANPPVPLAAVFIAVIGILATGHEYRYGTIQPTLTAIPRRSTVLVAKIIVVAAVATAFAVVSMIANVAVGTVFWGEFPDLTSHPLDEALPGYLILVLLWGVLGTVLGQLFRGVASPLILILAVPLVVEQLIFRLSFVPALDWLQPAVKFLPFLAGQQLVNLSGEAGGTTVAGSGFELFDRWAAGGVFATFVAIILIAARTLFERRDA
ncbi:ABC-2 family transporter [Micromonospora pisi]|uniref:ABC-2 family transporter n=1 Tax=Micromonospora pisi TaxID=589240 RepID=A0A495JQ60_9ACTN|nr:ABC transporter permease [Micromonospora pisi]RKR91103.1 ABC-2 family transporter [Micromonospora pisi]